jgi:hypothetical protein
MKTFLPKSGLLTCVFNHQLFFLPLRFAQTATVTTDKLDYYPSEYVKFQVLAGILENG